MTDTTEIPGLIVETWRKRAIAQGLKPGTMKYRRAEAEFATGAMAAMAAIFGSGDANVPKEVPAHWIINMMTGREVFADD